MGAEATVSTLEEMCMAMCDNVLPVEKESEWWIFTFGCGQEYAGKYVKIRGTFEEARTKMIEKYGEKWAFQYSLENWEKMRRDKTRVYYMETELEVIE